jgi:hypothetical protein
VHQIRLHVPQSHPGGDEERGEPQRERTSRNPDPNPAADQRKKVGGELGRNDDESHVGMEVTDELGAHPLHPPVIVDRVRDEGDPGAAIWRTPPRI